MWQTIAVVILIALALGYTVWRLKGVISGKRGCGCGCSSCPGGAEQKDHDCCSK